MNRQKIPPPEAFLSRVFKALSHAKKTFGRLVELGCDPRMLRDWMYQISASFTMLRSRGIGNRRYLAAWDLIAPLSEGEVRKLHDQLLSVAVTIHDLGSTRFASHMKLMGFLREGDPFEMRRYNFLLAQQFHMLPSMLIEYAESLTEAYHFLAKYYAPKKWDVGVAFEAEWLDNVKDSTGKFHFQEIAVLLEASCDTLTNTSTEVTSDARNRFTEEAVRRRYRRFRRSHPRMGLKYPHWSKEINT